MQQCSCPYCDNSVEKPAPDFFTACPLCGYRFARVRAGADGYLIIDSRLPDLMLKYKKLRQQEGDSVIVIDRRIGQSAIAGADRRR